MSSNPGNFVPGLFTPVLAKHTKSFNLIDTLSVGVDRIQRNFEPLQRQVETWRRTQITDDAAKLILYSAFIDGKLEAPRSLLPEVHRLYFEPQYPEFSARTMWSLSNAFEAQCGGPGQSAKALRLPIVVTTTARDSMWGPTFPELVEALPGIEIIDRSSVNAFDNARVARAIEATGRKKLIFAGISLEVCAALPAMTAVGKGLDAYVAVDASGTFSETKRQVGLLRMLQAGVIVSDYTTLMEEILKDNARPEAGAVYGAMDMPWAKLVGQIAHAYGK